MDNYAIHVAGHGDPLDYAAEAFGWKLEEIDFVFPILFWASHEVDGVGAKAKITMRGGIVLTREQDDWLAHGYKPGGLSGTGDSPNEAVVDLLLNLATVLDDTAQWNTDSFADFEKAITKMFAETDDWATAKWTEGVAAVAANPAELTQLPGNWPKAVRDFLCRVEKLDSGAQT